MSFLTVAYFCPEIIILVLKTFVESYFTALPLNKENVLYKDLFIKDMDENICIYL